jgi:hypothetical protein
MQVTIARAQIVDAFHRRQWIAVVEQPDQHRPRLL